MYILKYVKKNYHSKDSNKFSTLSTQTFFLPFFICLTYTCRFLSSYSKHCSLLLLIAKVLFTLKVIPFYTIRI